MTTNLFKNTTKHLETERNEGRRRRREMLEHPDPGHRDRAGSVFSERFRQENPGSVGGPRIHRIIEPHFRSTQKFLNTETLSNTFTVQLHNSVLFSVFSYIFSN